MFIHLDPVVIQPQADTPVPRPEDAARTTLTSVETITE
jgi:hypothetical protein